jgi:peptidoglycan/LPS O-acetylase OafA/YrhL
MNRIRSLDGFRAVSIVIVILSHAQASTGFPDILRPILVPGAAGVQVFFVLSGYLITGLLLSEQAAKGKVSLRNFYVRRFFRIVPALLLLVAGVAVYDWHRGWQIPRIVYLNALTFTTGIVPLQPGGRLLQHTWSLSVEEQFYVLWPVFFARATPRTRYILMGTVIAVWPVLRVASYVLKLRFVAHSSIGWADSLMVGCAIATLARDFPGRLDKVLSFHPRGGRAIAALTFISIAKLSGAGRLGVITVPAGATLMALAIGYLVASYAKDDSGLVGRFLTARPIVALGILSYSLYLWQEPFTVEEIDLPVARSLFWKTFPLNVGLSLAFAIVSYVFVERPLMRLRHRFMPNSQAPAIEPPSGSPEVNAL